MSEAGPTTCPACGGIDIIGRNILPDLGTRTCSSCGLIQGIIHRTDPATPEFALVDQNAYIRSVGASRRRQATRILGPLRHYIAPGASLVDVGCSFGFFLDEARRAGFRVTGLEPDPQAHAYAQRLLGDGVVRRGVLTPDTARDVTADVVATLDVVEHISVEEHEGFAASVRSVLAPRGVWVIKVPSTEGMYYRLSELLATVYPSIGGSLVRRLWQTRYEYPHLVYFSLRTLTLWLERFGFRVAQHLYLPEVPTGTIVDRLTTDGDIGRVQAYLAAPAVFGVTLLDSIRGKSDALVVFARVAP